ncbi:MAG TPA: glycosyltransferase [Alphaproteobacteria bacterium]|nr:glycosyltransferase [Alphaproteobacteria bacterium]
MKILHCAETIKGGIATYLGEVLPWQIAEFGPSQVHVLVPGNQTGELSGIPPTSLHVFTRRRRNIVALFTFAIEFIRVARDVKPAIVHLHGSFAGFIGRLLALLACPRAKVIYCAHGWAFLREAPRWQNEFLAHIEKFLVFITHKIICISRYEFDAARRIGLPSEKLALIVNGIAPLAEAVEKPPRDQKIFLFVGRLDKQKGFDLLLNALRLIDKPDFTVKVAGGAVLDNPQYALPSCIQLLGWVPRHRLAPLYAEASALIMPSRWEGFGFSAVEAMSCGTPVLASHAGALPEIVKNGQTGILLDPDGAIAFADLLQSVSPSQLNQMGRVAAEDMRARFTAERMNAELLQLYRAA